MCILSDLITRTKKSTNPLYIESVLTVSLWRPILHVGQIDFFYILDFLLGDLYEELLKSRLWLIMTYNREVV